ncbi:auxilin-like protein, partial [Trifolium pratense]
MLPIFDLSRFASKDTVLHKAQHVFVSGLFSKIVQDMKVNFDMTTTQKTVFGCLQACNAQYFLLVILIDELGQHMSAVEYCTILIYHLMIPLFPIDEVCLVCRKACLDQSGEHACRELSGFKYRHDFVKDVFCDIFKRAYASLKKEASVNFLIDPQEGRSTLKPIDVLVYDLTGGRHACVDLTEIFPLVGLRSGDFSVGQAALKAASSKVAKYENVCYDNQHVFIPLAFDTFGFLALDVADLLKRVQRIVYSNIVSP